MTLPNFLIIGANKAGTSSLYAYLRQHPEIYMSMIKEPSFFSFLNQDIDRTRPDLKDIVNNFEDYEALFKNVSNEKAIGEASTAYLPNKKVPNLIKEYLPGVKLIAILRDPSERAYSNYLMHVKWQMEEISDFGKALDKIKDNPKIYPHSWRYTSLGFYHSQLKNYYDIFGPEQIKVYLYEEDFCKNPIKLIKDIFNFLGVDDSFTPNLSQRHNENSNKIPLHDSIRKQLISIYYEDIVQLQTLLKRDLSRWLE